MTTQPTATTWTAGDVKAMLSRHYLPENRPPAGILATEIMAPDGQRFADAIWMPTTWTTGTAIVGHEIKVSRADVLAELADPTKADTWAKYCDRWWLVVADPALIAGLDVPQQWGVMAPPSGRRTRTMTIIRSAPPLTPIDQGRAYHRLAAWVMHHERDAARDLRIANADLERRVTALQRSVDGWREQLGALEAPDTARLARIIAATKERLRDHRVWGEATDQQIVAAIVDQRAAHQAAAQTANAAEHAHDSLRRLINGHELRGILNALAALSVEANTLREATR